jgi:ESCRT-II complex subunit VPS36
MAITKDMLGAGGGNEQTYLSELSRVLAEYLTDDRRGVLSKQGGIMSLVDLWALFNRVRNGIELVSPADFEKAARLWEVLKLPVRLREFRSGLLVVQRYDWSDDKTIAQLLDWLQTLRLQNTLDDGLSDLAWSLRTFGKGVTAAEVAGWFGWSVGVATEELEMAEEKGVLCREEGVEGLRFWENWIIEGPWEEL